MQSFLVPLRRWWLLLVVAGALSAGSSIIALQNIPPTYRATSTIIIGQTLDNPNPNSGEFFLSQQLASIYTSLAMREPIKEATRNALGLSELPEYAVRAVANNPFIEVSVTDVTPLRAQAVADEIAYQIILQSPSSSEQEEQARADFLNAQLDSLQLRIEETQIDLADLQLRMAEMVSASDLERAQESQTLLQERLLTYQTNYANILASSGTGASNILRIFENAPLPTRPIGPGNPIIVFMASFFGVALAGGGVYLIEYFDNRLKTPEAIAATLDLPVAGYIPDSRIIRAQGRGDSPPSPFDLPAQENLSFELLATNLTFRFSEPPPKTLLVTSLSPGSGKTTVASQLAVQLTRRGQLITLIDADLRNPDLHRRFALDLYPGLGDAIQDSLKIESVVQDTVDARLSLVSSGSRIDDPNLVFKPAEVIRILGQLDTKQKNLVIIDSPPVIVSETLLLASKVDAVLLVVRPGEITESTAKILLNQVRNSKGNIIGLVINKIPAFLVGSYGMTPYLKSAKDGEKKDHLDIEIAGEEPSSEHQPAFVEEDE